MKPLFRACALLTLLLWLPATAHCALESLEFEIGTGTECCDHDAANEPGCADGRCAVFENSLFRVTDHGIQMADALASVSAFLPLIGAVETGCNCRRLVREGSVGPPGLSSTWQFCERAAAPARAPALLL